MTDEQRVSFIEALRKCGVLVSSDEADKNLLDMVLDELLAHAENYEPSESAQGLIPIPDGYAEQ